MKKISYYDKLYNENEEIRNFFNSFFERQKYFDPKVHAKIHNGKIPIRVKIRRDIHRKNGMLTGAQEYIFKIIGHKPTISVYCPIGTSPKYRDIQHLYMQLFYDTPQGQRFLKKENERIHN